MSGSGQSLIHPLIDEEIRCVVAECVRDGSCLSAAHNARAIARAYPNCGLSAAEIAERIIAAAVQARIAVEMSRPEAWRVAS